MDRSPGQRTADGGTAGPPDPAGSHLGSQRRELPADGCQTPAETKVNLTNLRPQAGASWRLEAPPPAAFDSKRNQQLDEDLQIQSSLPGGCSTFRAPPAALFNRRLHMRLNAAGRPMLGKSGRIPIDSRFGRKPSEYGQFEP